MFDGCKRYYMLLITKCCHFHAERLSIILAIKFMINTTNKNFMKIRHYFINYFLVNQLFSGTLLKY